MCYPGQYQDLIGQPYCKPCATGGYQNQVGQSSCKSCPSGTYFGGTGAPQCNDCSFGQYQNEDGESSCKPCAAGTFQNVAGESSCQPCSSGKYYGGTGAISSMSCASCPTGKTSNAGATTSSMCTHTCNNIDGSGNSFPVSSCLGTGTLKNDLTIVCASTPCVDTDCCVDLLPNTEGSYWNDRSTGLKKVVDDWIAGGTERAAVEVKYGFIENWDTSAVTRMDYLFYGKSSLDADLSKCKFFVFFWFCLANVFNI